MKRYTILVWVCFALLNVQSFAQSVYLNDAVRFSTPGLGVGARSLGMGSAYVGVANDYSALFWNPAGLAQLKFGEFSFGLSDLDYRDQSTYFGLTHSQAKNSITLNTLGIAVPVPVTRGSLVLAFGYNRESNFTTAMSLNHPNGNSIVQSYSPDRAEIFDADRENNLGWMLFLADTIPGSGHWVRFTTNGRPDSAYAHLWDSPIKDRITQVEKVLEGGGISNWTVGGAVDVAKQVSLGISLSYQTGTYKYDGTYNEQDDQNVYSSDTLESPRNFSKLEIGDLVDSDISGFSAKFGLMFREPDRYRLGINIKTPTVYTVKESFGTTYASIPDFGKTVTVEPTNQSNEYDLITPWVFSVGGSYIIEDFLVSGDIEYADWTQMEFRNANSDILALNRKIKDTFRGAANIRIGAEYTFQRPSLRIRGGFIYNTSPYQNDPSSYDQKYVTAGLGIPLGESTMLDLAYAHGWWDTIRSDYARFATIQEKVATNNFFGMLSFRF